MKIFREVIQKVSRGEKLAKDLTREEAREALAWIFEGEASEFQMGAFFAAMRMKGESAEETAGFVEAVRERAQRIHPKLEGILDLGEPYDGKVKTLHLTVPVALILAAAEVPVVLHSAPEIPVKKGVETQRILEALGVESIVEASSSIQEDASTLCSTFRQILEEEKIVFLPTEKLIPDFAKLRPYREAFGLRPFANHIEKIFNLSRATTQMVGIYHRPYLEPMAQALTLLGTERIFVIQGVEGFTEFYLSRKTLVLQREAGKTETFWLDPKKFGFRGEEEPAPGKGSLEHAKRILELLHGARGPAREGMLWNAGVKLFWMNKVRSLEESFDRAREILDSGKALRKLEALRHAAQEKTNSKKV